MSGQIQELPDFRTVIPECVATIDLELTIHYRRHAFVETVMSYLVD